MATLLECKWNEHPTSRDARAMANVGTLFANAKPVGLASGGHYVVARPPHDFPINSQAQAVHGLRISGVLAPGIVSL